MRVQASLRTHEPNRQRAAILGIAAFAAQDIDCDVNWDSWFLFFLFSMKNSKAVIDFRWWHHPRRFTINQRPFCLCNRQLDEQRGYGITLIRNWEIRIRLVAKASASHLIDANRRFAKHRTSVETMYHITDAPLLWSTGDIFFCGTISKKKNNLVPK